MATKQNTPNTHTAGPWHTGSTGNSGKGLAICDGPIAIATVIATGYPLGKGIGTHDLANARLIAAAPDMLAALEELVRRLAQAGGLGIRQNREKALDAARAAIAKATQ